MGRPFKRTFKKIVEYKYDEFFDEEVEQEVKIEPYFFDMFLRLSCDVECKEFPKELTGYPKELQPFLDKLYAKNSQKSPKLIHTIDLPEHKVKKSKDVLVAFSGGHDSLAVALKLKADGYNPILFHGAMLNRAFPRETKICRRLRKILDMKYIELHLKVSGKSSHIETPLKNHFVMGAMVDYGISKGICNFAQGTLKTETWEKATLSLNYSDSSDIWTDTLAPFYTKIMKTFKQHIFLNDNYDSYRILYDLDKDKINEISSCMLRDMYLNNVRKANAKKFPNVKLGNHSCGSCYKCVREYLMVTHLKGEEYDFDYITKCMGIVKRHIETMTDGGKVAIDDYKTMLGVVVHSDSLEDEMIKKINSARKNQIG